MRFPVMLTKDNDKKVKELNNIIRKWIDRYEKEKDYSKDYEMKYRLNKSYLENANEQIRDLKGEIKELKIQLKNKDKGIKAMKDMLEERITDEE
ncbi:MAG: hypothetical protein ACRC7S_14055 [Cetobacterium sp.]